jgi:hypothetical protein
LKGKGQEEEMSNFQYFGHLGEVGAPLALKKGDIFFWGSRIIHGSTPGTNPRLRRRSLAAHFVPAGLRFGNLERDFELNFKEKYGLTYAYYSLDESFARLNHPLKQAPLYQSLRKLLKSRSPI